MAKNHDYDVVIAGAGTTGSYLAWKLAAGGYRCLILEKDRLDMLGESIGPFHMEEVAFERFDIPLPSGDELLHTVSDVTMWSPGMKPGLRFQLPTLVMDKPRFIRRLHGYARKAGAEILEQTEVTGLVLDRGFLRGVTARQEDGEIEVEARLVIDATGIDTTVRALMPPGRWLETEPIKKEDTIFVYMETWRDISGDMEPGVSSYPYFQGWCAPGPGETKIVGIGMTGSADAAISRHKRFIERLPYSGKVEGSTIGRIPYRRPPYSLVDNGFLVVGDAAFMNKPFSGEGVTAAFAACLVAQEVIEKALDRDDVTREALWPYNVGYFREQGSKFAFLTAILPTVMSIAEDEMDIIFSVPGILSEEGALALQLDYEVKKDANAGLKALPHILKGLARGQIRLKTLLSLAGMAAVAGKLKKLYEEFPERPADFGLWVNKVDPLWKRAEQAKHRYFSELN